MSCGLISTWGACGGLAPSVPELTFSSKMVPCKRVQSTWTCWKPDDFEIPCSLKTRWNPYIQWKWALEYDNRFEFGHSCDRKPHSGCLDWVSIVEDEMIARYERKPLTGDFKRKSLSGDCDPKECVYNMNRIRTGESFLMQRQNRSAMEKASLFVIDTLNKFQSTFNNLAFIPRPPANLRRTINDHGTSKSTWEVALHLGDLTAKGGCDLQEINPV